jgi:alpha-beta hydrolase superfamily lysophospholipase
MYKRSEGFFKGDQDTKLFFQIWENPDAQGTIIITHGHGEHSDSYHRLIKAFESDKWSFYGWDLRGHGRSEGRRGYATEFDAYCRDYKLFLRKLLESEKIKKGPVVLYSHSMGALIQLKTLLRNHDILCDAIVVSAPLLGLSLPVPLLKSKGAILLNSLLPQVTLGNEITNDMLTRDFDVIREYEQDALRHTRMSPGVFLGILESWGYVQMRAGEVRVPTLFILPENDPVVSTPKAKTFFEKIESPHKELFIYPESKHELINDINRTTVYADLKKFLDSILELKK